MARDQARLDAWTGTLAEMAATLRQEWQQAGADAASRQQQICEALADTARQISDQSRAHASDTLAEINRLVDAAAEAPKAAVALQSDLVARDEARLDAWTGSLAGMAAALREEWQQTGAATASRQQEICDALAQAARDISEHTHTHASATIAEIERLAQAASEAPRAAAEVIGELRQKLSDSLAHDNAMLEERGRLLDTLATLLDAVNLASTEQRAAVDALVGTTSELMDRVGAQFSERVESETGKLAEISAQVTGSAVEVASLGEAFGAAVQLFSASNDKLATQLERIEAALDKSIARGDEQLSYYVSQAREVVDLSLMSQKQIIEDLQHLASQRADAGPRPHERGFRRRRGQHRAHLGGLRRPDVGAAGLVRADPGQRDRHAARTVDPAGRRGQAAPEETHRRESLEQVLAGPLAAGRVTLVNGRIGISGSVLFALNSDQLQPEGRELLRSLAEPLTAYLGTRQEILMVSGFTDDQQVREGNRRFADNWDLSAQRALTVTRTLIDAGVPSSSLFAAAFGSEQPVASNADAEGQAKNRRVEIAPVPRRRRPGQETE